MTSIKFGKVKQGVKMHVALAKALKDDDRVPKVSRLLLALAVAYFFLPVDLIPDFVPILGHLDDIVIIPLLIWMALRYVPKEVYEEHHRRIFSE